MSLAIPPLLEPYDQWGALVIPTAAGSAYQAKFTGWGTLALGGENNQPTSDPCLAVILDWLACFLVSDGNVADAWKRIGGQDAERALKTVWLHDPREAVFKNDYPPALFLWRDQGTAEYRADDWQEDRTTVKGLYVYPFPKQEVVRLQRLFANALFKAMCVGIERGRTPSWTQDGDEDPAALRQGSLFYPYAGFDSFDLKGWRRSKLVVDGAAGSVTEFPAVEFTFELVEHQVYGLERNPPFAPLTAQALSIYTSPPGLKMPDGLPVWAPSTAYDARRPDFILPIAQVPGDTTTCWYQCTTSGTSGSSAPTWTTVPLETVNDGSGVWTCIGPAQTLADSADVASP